MGIDKDTLFWLVDNNVSQKFEMKIGDLTCDVEEFTLSYSEIPVSRPTTRGGVYFSDKMGFKIKARISDDLSKVLSKTMLGPNADFAKIQFVTSLAQNGTKKDLRLYANLTNYVQRSSGLELNLMVIETE
jgi:hypothetical protein